MIQPKSTTVGEILTLAKHFVVPRYQRGYAWEANEAGEFLDDLETEAEIGRGLFLGTIIFNVAEDAEDKIEIVDGQQRLTTIFLLLIACRELAKELKHDAIAQETQKRITVTDPTTAKSRGPLLVASDTIRDVFDLMATNEWDGAIPQKIGNKPVKRQARRVRPIYEFFQRRVKDYNQPKLSRLLDAVYKTRVIRIDILGDEEAFSIFERTNARGTDLEVSDLLKNYLYQQRTPDLDDKWKEIIQNSEGTILKMLKYFYVSKNGYINKSELYPKLKKYSKDIGGAEQLVEEMTEFSKFYVTVRKEEPDTAIKAYFEGIGCEAIASEPDKYQRVHLALQALRLFNVSQIYPVISAAVNALMRTGGAKDKAAGKTLIKLLDSMEKYHFINNAICDRVGNEVEKLYASYCEKFDKTKDFAGTVTELVQKLRGQLASKNEFTTRFSEITYGPDSIALLVYIFDRFSNFNVAPGERVNIFDPQAGINRNNHNVEHFLPQKPEDGTPIDSATVQVIDNIGNLLVISFRANSSLGNITPAKKIEKLDGELLKKVQNLHYVREFIGKYGKDAGSWDEARISGRAKDMASEAYEQVWKL
ncbi:MAG TPA: DUF262 domain-containing HNH endonuclease family protein [Candidatus Bathyarchaeia archaeon]|jgi:hypothetical protein|nr:DUF262 domain-containing HNH endonuclease family protein [Candidatus Bathyarchaeia archaeon]